jgi:hypothetical protein
VTAPKPYRPDAQGLADASLTPEARFQVQVIGLARRLNYRAYHTHDSRRSEAGFPDLVLVRPPRVIFIELKSGRRRLTLEQLAWMAELETCTEVDAFVLRSGRDGSADLTALAERLR